MGEKDDYDEDYADDEMKGHHDEMIKNNSEHPDNKKLEGVDIKKVGPNLQRHCTDIFFLLLLVCTWVAMTGVGFVACGVVKDNNLKPGNPARLINAIDYIGNICGVDDAVCGRGDLDNIQDDCKNKNSGAVTKTDIAKNSKGYYLPSGAIVCTKSCPSADNFDEFICEYDVQSYMDTLSETEKTIEGWKRTARYQCMPKVESTEYLGYCVPTKGISSMEDSMNAATEESINMKEPEEKDFFQKIQADVLNSMGIIFGVGVGVTIVVGFLFLYFLRIPFVLTTIIWGIILSIFLCFFLPGIFLVSVTYPEWSPKQNDDSVHTEGEAKAILYFGYFFLACAFLFACFICCIRSRISLAISITKEACKAFAAMPMLLIFPVLQAIGIAIFLIPWVIYCAYLASSGEVTVIKLDGVVVGRDFAYDDNTQTAGLFMLFCFFWTTQFVVAMGQLVIAMSVVSWYFTRSDEKSKIGNSTVFKCLRQSFRYHMGSAAFGSLIIAIIKTIRAILNYLKKKALAAASKKRDDPLACNPIGIIKKLVSQTVLCFICCVDCCMWCVEKCMKFINKNAYIQIAIFGYSFCTAARKAFFLILRNLLRIAAVGMVSEIVATIGKLFIPSVTLFIGYFALMKMDLYSFWFPLLLTFFISWVVTDVFLEIFAMCISTILQCFCADEELFKDDPYAEGALRKAIATTKKNNKAARGCLQCGGAKNTVAPVNEAAQQPSSQAITNPGRPESGPDL